MHTCRERGFQQRPFPAITRQGIQRQEGVSALKSWRCSRSNDDRHGIAWNWQLRPWQSIKRRRGSHPREGKRGRLAQLEERLVYTQEVGSSRLSPPTTRKPMPDL